MENINNIQQNNKNQDNRMSDILNKIKLKEISVHSKTFFRLKWSAFVLLVLSICVVSIMLCSFILFTIRMTGQPYLIGFGSKGIQLAFIIFPWMLFLIDGVLIVLLGSLTRHTSFGYKIPGVYVLIGVILIVGISGYIVDEKTSFHRSMLDYADHKQLPLFENLYKNIRKAPPKGYEIYRGVVVGEMPGYVRVDLDNEDGTGTTSTVIIRVSTTSPYIADTRIGQTVFIAGKIVDGQVIDARIKHAPRLPPPVLPLSR